MSQQTNNDYLKLPESLHNVYRSADDKLFHYPSCVDVTPEEWKIIMKAWQDCEVRSGHASWENEPCRWCGECVCVCQAYPQASFTLPPSDSDGEVRGTRHVPSPELLARRAAYTPRYPERGPRPASK